MFNGFSLDTSDGLRWVFGLVGDLAAPLDALRLASWRARESVDMYSVRRRKL